MTGTLEERIAQLALDTFNSCLPPKCKPRNDPATGVQEWVPMSAIVFAQQIDNNDTPPTLHLAALATGSKCLPANILPKASGLILHDSHSEILALRALNYFFLREALQILTTPDYTSKYLIYNKNTPQNEYPFSIHPSTSIHLFSTEPPCGDASMEFIISAQPDATPWSIPSTNNQTKDPLKIPSLPGRSYFSNLSIVRRKPSRPDAPPTLSKSCTDKLTLKQFTSVLSSLSSLLISPQNAYIATFTVPFDKYNEGGYTRAFTTNGRLRNLPEDIETQKIEGGGGVYSFHPLTPTPLPKDFIFTYKYSKPPPQDTKTKASNISTLYINHPENPTITEVLISGVKQGNGQLSTAPGDRKGSVVCRKKMWQLLRDISDILGNQELKERVERKVYAELKTDNNERSTMKDTVTRTLGGWEKNRGDHDWGL
ncbi:hypothetical protein TWF281_005684 [Arthrobotrys megalospora]